jgi:hypothetical protein
MWFDRCPLCRCYAGCVSAQVGDLTDDVTAAEDRMSFTNVVSLRDPTIERVCYRLRSTSLKWLT